MLAKLVEAQKKIQDEISRVFKTKTDTSTIGLAMLAARQATSLLIELVNPVIITRTGEIKIYGIVYAISAAQLKKEIQQRYPEYGRFPAVVEDYLRHGENSAEFEAMRRQFRIDNVRRDLETLRAVYGGNERKTIVFLSRLEPTILSVFEYTTSGAHTSGMGPLQAIEVPFVLNAESASFPFSSPEARITDGRTEIDMVANLINFSSSINDVKGSVSVREEGTEKRHLRDALSILSIALLSLGLGLIAIRRGAAVELGFIFAFWERSHSISAGSVIGLKSTSRPEMWPYLVTLLWA